MDEKFLTGVLLGMLGGALILTNSSKARQAVKDGQQKVVEAMNNMGGKSKQKSKSSQSK